MTRLSMMARLTGPHYPRQLELEICEAIATLRLLEFDYEGYHRIVQPYCHGFSRKGEESLRAVEVSAGGRSGGRGFGKLWTVAKMQNTRVGAEPFLADDPDYNPDDSALPEIHCRVELRNEVTTPSTTVVIGFHQDAEGDWVAELACGHSQHVRHRPPWQNRPWVTTAAGREAKLGTPIECPSCDEN